jgi:hypothetical protein
MDIKNETFSRLKLISKIQIGDKINLNKDISITPDGVITQISRMLYQENRMKTLVFVQDTINKTFEILKCYERSNKKTDIMMCKNLLKDLKSSKIGLSNLKETYSNDVKYQCDIEVVLQLIDTKISESPLEINTLLVDDDKPSSYEDQFKDKI